MAILPAISPLDGRLLGEYPAATADEIALKLQRARAAAGIWGQTPVRERCRILAKFGELVLAEIDPIVDCLRLATGKVACEALLGEIYPLLDLLAYYRKHAPDILADRSVATSPFAFPGATAGIRYRPVGVAAIISPWNYPFQLSVAPLLTALFAGNA
nr:aldehyde dehydrogenase family protein [Methylomonas koyamae]